MPEPGVGFEYPSVPVSWLKRDVLLFANTVGATADELHFLYVRTYPQSLDFMIISNRLTGAASQLRRLPDLSHHPPYEPPNPHFEA